MASKAPARFEWISLVYLFFFALSVMSPSLIQHDYFGLGQTQLEELTIFIFGMMGIVTFSFYQRFMEHREQERRKAEDDFHKAQRELIESYTYIGSINRKIELLKKLADTSTVNVMESGRIPKEIFHALAANACATVGAEACLIRFVELSRLRTEREFTHAPNESSSRPEGAISLRVANKDLRALHERGSGHAVLPSEDGGELLVVPSDGSRPLKGYLLLRVDAKKLSEVDTSLLKVFVNQAEMLYAHFTAGEESRERLPQLVETV